MTKRQRISEEINSLRQTLGWAEMHINDTIKFGGFPAEEDYKHIEALRRRLDKLRDALRAETRRLEGEDTPERLFWEAPEEAPC